MRISRTNPDHRLWMLSRVALADTGYLTPCWLWSGCRDERGYGKTKVCRNGKIFYIPHRVAYETLVGPIPDGLEVDHLCFVKSCCNPEHLEAVTPSENARRARERWPDHWNPSHCVNGHEFTAENTAFRLRIREGGAARRTGRVCLSCRTNNTRAYQMRKKAARQTPARRQAA